MLKQWICTTLFLSFLPVSATADDWPNWRGLEHQGASKEINLPSAVDLAKDLRWFAVLPGTSSATPIISGGRVFLVSNNENDHQVFGICIDAESGDILWQKLLAEIDRVPTRNTMASCSPVTDGKTVYMLSGTGKFYAFDFDGKVLWFVDLPERYGHIGQQFGYSSTPLLLEGKLYLPILRGQWETGGAWGTFTDKDSQVVCLNAATGAEVWRTHRGSDANGESFDSYASAVPYSAGGQLGIVVQGGDFLTGYNAATGAELWRQEHNPRKGGNWRLIPSPVVAEGFAIGIQPRGGDAFGVNVGSAKKRIRYEDSDWILSGRLSDVPTPAVYNGNVYMVNGTRKLLICVDPATGKELWQDDLDASARIWASPTAGDGKIYCLDEGGQLTIAGIEGGFKILSQTKFGGAPTKSSVAIADGSLYIRTADRLYRVGG